MVPRNGFNPTWNETVVFPVVRPEFAFLEFRVKSSDSEDHLGSYIASLASIRQGYRYRMEPI